MLDPPICQVLEELSRDIFTAVVTMKALNTPPRLRLHPRYELPEELENIGFRPHEVDQGVPGVVVSKDNKVGVT
jgi:hypothetical protein